MSQHDWEMAQRYALHRLETELPAGLYYHNVLHTTQEVVPAVEKLAASEGIYGGNFDLLRTAAWFHDLGFIEAQVGHERIGARLASEALPAFGFSPAQIDVIRNMILATIVPQSPANSLERIMADADLDVLGRDDFMNRNRDLRRELAFFGYEPADSEWYAAQLRFVETHEYFTASARGMRDAGKLRNAAALRRLLAAASDGQ